MDLKHKKNHTVHIGAILLTLNLCLSFGCKGISFAASFTARSAVEKNEVFLGEPFVFQIQIEGTDTPDKPDVSVIKDFNVQDLGGRSNSSSSVTIINGRMTRKESKAYIFSYQLTPLKTGNLSLPSFRVFSQGETVLTRPVYLKVAKPSETEDFKLRMELSSKKSYTGQPVTLTITWYIGKDVEKFQFSMPVLSDDRFSVSKMDTRINQARKNLYLTIPIGDEDIIGKRGRGVLNGREYMTVSFQMILIPKKTGSIKIPQTTVAFEAVMGYQKRSRTRSPFDDFFNDDFFGGRKRTIRKKFVVPSNEPSILVSALPVKGKPKGFNGLVGRYSLTAKAAPLDVSVGDPITLTIKVTGENYMDDVKLPPLDKQEILTRDFKIPSEMASGKVNGRVKTFVQTIRARHAKVDSIPAVELPYFDVQQGKYMVARSPAIPLNVKTARIVTALDAEGLKISPAKSKTELETWAAGIAHNYEDLSVLKNQGRGVDMFLNSPGWIALIVIPPSFYILLLCSGLFVSWRKSDPEGRQSKRAYSKLTKELGRCGKMSGDTTAIYVSILDTFRQYLGSKLKIPSKALTFSDVKDLLTKHGIGEESLDALKILFEAVEERRFAGSNTASEDSSAFLSKAFELAKKFDRRLKIL